MAIISQSAALSFSGNLSKFVISSSVKVEFVLKQGEEILFEHIYDPGTSNIIEIDIRELVESRLEYVFKETSEIYRQDKLAGTFTAIIGSSSYSFRVIRGGVDNFADTATNFLTQNFLTWQPGWKKVTYHTPEFLTYYAVVNSTIKLKAYFPEKETATVTLGSLSAGYAYTIPVQYAAIVKYLNERLPGAYDIWIEDLSGNRLTYIQRYEAEAMRTEEELWFLFENSLGGMDTFRAYGSMEFKGDHTHNIVEVEDLSSEYRVDTERLYTKNTGYLTAKERRWLLDFFPSRKKYLFSGECLRSIVVTESDVTYTAEELPSNYTFTYKYAESRSLLNLPRTDSLPEVLDIEVPELGSFTLPPRLVEFPRLPLSEGALFPVQNPYAEEWHTTTAGALGEYIKAYLGADYDGNGGVGHVHDNIDLLQLLSFLDGYLKVDNKKIRAGYADESGVARIFQTENFINSMTSGKGGAIDVDGNGQVESLEVRSALKVLELIFNRLNIQEGDYTFTEGGTIEAVTEQSSSAYLLTLRKRFDEDMIPFVTDDILYGIYHQTGGFFTSWMRVVNVNHSNNTILTVLADNSEVPAGVNYPPAVGMNLARRGNFTDKERQSSWYLSSYDGQIVFLDGVDNYKIDSTNRAMVLGLPKNLPIPEGLPVNPEQPYLYARGAIIQDLIRIDYQGKVIKDIVDNGEWQEDVQYVNSEELRRQDDVWWINCRWRCIAEKATIGSAPTWDSTEWLMVSGDKTLLLTIESTNGTVFNFNSVETTLVATVWQGQRNITALIADSDWSWVRDSGEALADTSWNSSYSACTRELPLTLTDMGSNWSQQRRVKFTCTAYVRDGENIQHVSTTLNVNI